MSGHRSGYTLFLLESTCGDINSLCQHFNILEALVPHYLLFSPLSKYAYILSFCLTYRHMYPSTYSLSVSVLSLSLSLSVSISILSLSFSFYCFSFTYLHIHTFSLCYINTNSSPVDIFDCIIQQVATWIFLIMMVIHHCILPSEKAVRCNMTMVKQTTTLVHLIYNV